MPTQSNNQETTAAANDDDADGKEGLAHGDLDVEHA